MTHGGVFVVLRHHPDDGRGAERYEFVGNIKAASRTEAVRKAAEGLAEDDLPASLVAIPARSFVPKRAEFVTTRTFTFLPTEQAA